MKVRLTNEQIERLSEELIERGLTVEEAAGRMFGSFEVDDTSLQTLSTLVFQCPFCGEWRSIKEEFCSLCRPDEVGWYEDDELNFSERVIGYPGELEELPEE